MMNKVLRRCGPMLFLIVVIGPCASAQSERQIPITVDLKPADDVLTTGKPLLFRVTISNNLPQEIRFSTFSLTPNSWNGETANLELPDIYRRPRTMAVFLARPKMTVPEFLEGAGSYVIKSHQSLALLVDISKWQIIDGWQAGKYSINVRVNNLEVDRYAKVSITSDPIEFEVKSAHP
ncbi:MAG TPA: hypothetical protein VE961_19860 [Pyrinomonadaceae bacterium]|nr:hypothetical protein [Pyrinomonadaceae bacterium]